ncbi:hypothetical protein PG996_001992 [Apiospora saccharicola]|uniref:Rrn9 domain-containing protein n=1 Tax=Apiospora saccharicola TaxID=335842 RepID=A0ABR1WL62_9PEZI
MSRQSNGSSFTPPALDHETVSTPPTRPCSWIHENSYMCGELRLSSQSSRDESTAPSSLPAPEQPRIDMNDPWSPLSDGALLTQEEVHRRWALFSPIQRYQFQDMAKRYAELRQDIPSEAEEILSTSGAKMHVKKVLKPELFRNWDWDSASSRRRKSSTGEKTSSSGDNEDTYDEDEEEAYEMIDSMAFCSQRDSIEVRRESQGRRNSAEDYYRWDEDETFRGSLAQRFRRVTEKVISAVQSRCNSPQASKSNSPNNSDSDEAGGDNEPSASESPRTKSKLITFVQRPFSLSPKRRSQDKKQQGKPKHEPCHRSRHPSDPLLKNADKPGPILPVWSDRIGPKNERLEDLGACVRDLCVDSQKSIEPGHWLSGRC